LRRRHDPEIPAAQVRSAWGYDVAIAVERRLATGQPQARRRVARWRTEWFDRQLARTIARRRPGAALIFSDVGSGLTLPRCRSLGLPTILSMVHGDVREELEVLELEAESSPDFFPIYLGDGALDRDELAWLHERRLRDILLADHILVPSDHIARRLIEHGTPPEKIRVIPYAADTRRFRPAPEAKAGDGCTFLFAGGITQRKGIKYLLEAWRRIRRPGWKLQLLGALPSNQGPLVDYLDEVEHLGRVPHAEVPARMAAADVFVFPSLFEGSAVVTYEALACGLPSVVTPDAGSVVRDKVEGFVVPPRDVEALAERMERLGRDAELRATMACAARERALAFDWPRYHAAVVDVARHATKL
jgi:glycosyltransferase involved in cell wall biosynthesis